MDRYVDRLNQIGLVGLGERGSTASASLVEAKKKRWLGSDLVKRAKKHARRTFGPKRTDKKRSPRSIARIHKNDFIYRFLEAHPNCPTADKAIEFYLETGRKSAENLKEVLEQSNFAQYESILEFASGYGCVTRHLTQIMPSAMVTACDIHPAAMRFIAKNFGVQSVLSTPVPENLQFDQGFDVVFALSFFSHMPKSTWARWLKAISAQARPGGAIVFTTHGLESWKMLGSPTLDEDGFSFAPESEQLDLEGAVRAIGGATRTPMS